MSMSRRRYGTIAYWSIIVGAPAAIGWLMAIALTRGWLPNLLIAGEYRIDLAGVIVRVGVIMSMGVISVLIVRWWSDRRTQRALQQAARAQIHARQDFLRRLDHELKNPLTIMHLGILNLQQSPHLDTEQQRSIQRIAQQTQRLQKLVVDLRWLAELDEGAVEYAPVDLADVLEEAIALARDGSNHAARPIELSVQETPWPVSPVAGDRELLVVAFRNLLDNALKYTESTDRIEVRAREDGRMAIVEVADTGSGIAEAEQDLIFENLYRSPNARGVAGSGLGLPLVQQITTLHGGVVRVRSRPQAGTVFTVQLPLVNTASSTPNT